MVNGFFNLPIPSLPLHVTFTIAFVCSQLDSLIILFPLPVFPHPYFYSLDYSLPISACSSMLRCVQVLTYLWSYKSVLWYDFLGNNIYPGQNIAWSRFSVSIYIYRSAIRPWWHSSNALDSCSECSVFKSRRRHRLSWSKFHVVLSVPGKRQDYKSVRSQPLSSKSFSYSYLSSYHSMLYKLHIDGFVH